MIKGLLFDLDGTIINSEEYYDVANIEIAAEYGKHYDRATKPLFMGRPNKEFAEHVVKVCDLPINAETFLKKRREKINYFYREKIDYLIGFESFFDKLTKRFNCKCAIVTACNKENFDISDLRLGLTKKFDGNVIRTDDIGKHKPDPEPFLHAARKLGVDCKNCLVFEDAPSGIVSGYRAGAKVIALTTTLDEATLFDNVRKIEPTIDMNKILIIEGYDEDSLKKVIEFAETKY